MVRLLFKQVENRYFASTPQYTVDNDKLIEKYPRETAVIIQYWQPLSKATKQFHL